MIENKSDFSELILRQVKESDAPYLVPLMEQLGYIIDNESMKENIQIYLLSNNLKSWVAELSGKVIGCIAVAITPYFHRQGKFMRVIALVVDSQRRKYGIGKKLMKLAEQFATDEGCSHVELTSGMHRAKLGSHDFYRSLNYTELNQKKMYFAKEI